MPEVAAARKLSGGSGLSKRRFEFEQAAFALEAPSVAAEMPRSAECAMAGDYNCDRICTIGSADGANRARSSDLLCNLTVRARLARRHRAHFIPNAQLKLGVADVLRANLQISLARR